MAPKGRPGVRKSIFNYGTARASIYSCHVEVIIFAPHALIAIFSSDSTLMDDAVSGFEYLLCGIHIYGLAVHRTDHL